MVPTTQQPPRTKKRTGAERRAERAAQAQRAQQQRQRRVLAIALPIALLLALGAFALIRTQQARQVGKAVAIEQGTTPHVTDPAQLRYNHYPPSSGPHFNNPQPGGVYDKEVSPGNWIHSLEHGYIVVLLRCPDGCPDTLKQFTDLYQNGLPRLVVTPYSGEFSNKADEQPITVLAWGRELMLPTFDRDTIVAFYSQYVDKGPERVP